MRLCVFKFSMAVIVVVLVLLLTTMVHCQSQKTDNGRYLNHYDKYAGPYILGGSASTSQYNSKSSTSGHNAAYGNTQYWRANHNSGYNSHQPAKTYGDPEPSDESIDWLYARTETVHTQLKAYSEQLEAITAEMNRQKKALEELTQTVFPALTTTDVSQNNALDRLHDHVDKLMDDLNNVLSVRILELKDLNEANLAALKNAMNTLRDLGDLEARQGAEIATLFQTVLGLKVPESVEILANPFGMFEDQVDTAASRLHALRVTDQNTICENGQVTLDAEDHRVEYQYQTNFHRVPQILYGLCGFNFNLHNQHSQPVTLDKYATGLGHQVDGYRSYISLGTGYGYGKYGGYVAGHDAGYGGSSHSAPQPEHIGARVNAFSSRTGLTLELFDLSFGDASAVSADVCFEACLANSGPVDH